MKLPVSIKFHHGETPLSFASRLAAANGYPSLDAFLQCTDTTALAIARGEDEAIALLNKWTGENQDALRRFAVRRVKEQLRFKLGDAIFGKDHRRGETHRFCVGCVQDDIRNGEGRKGSRAYVRAWWETKAIKTCPSHGTGITEVACERHGHDFSLFVRQNEALFDNEWVNHKAEHARTLDQYLLGRIYGDTGNGFLDSLDAYVVTGLCEYFGRLMRRYEAMREPENPEMDDAERGFNSVELGEAHIADLTSRLVFGDKASPEEALAPMDPIPRWLRRNRDNPAYATLVDLFQGLAERNLPLGEGDVFIVPTRKRYLHTVRSASVEYGLIEPRIVDLLTKAGQLPTDMKSNVCFDAEAARPILQAAQDTLCLTEAAAILDLNGVRLHELIHAGHLPRVEADRDDQRVYTRIRRQDLSTFQQRLFGRAVHLSDYTRYVPILKAVQKCNCQLRELVEMVLEGRIQGLARDGDALTFTNLYVDLDEVLKTRRLEAQLAVGSDLMNINSAAKLLKTTQSKVHALVASGILPSVERFNPTTRQLQRFVNRKAVDDFQRIHISVAQIAATYFTRADIIAQRMESLGVNPSFDAGSRSGRYYRRCDLNKFAFEPLAA